MCFKFHSSSKRQECVVSLHVTGDDIVAYGMFGRLSDTIVITLAECTSCLTKRISCILFRLFVLFILLKARQVLNSCNFSGGNPFASMWLCLCVAEFQPFLTPLMFSPPQLQCLLKKMNKNSVRVLVGSKSIWDNLISYVYNVTCCRL